MAIALEPFLAIALMQPLGPVLVLLLLCPCYHPATSLPLPTSTPSLPNSGGQGSGDWEEWYP